MRGGRGFWVSASVTGLKADLVSVAVWTAAEEVFLVLLGDLNIVQMCVDNGIKITSMVNKPLVNPSKVTGVTAFDLSSSVENDTN